MLTNHKRYQHPKIFNEDAVALRAARKNLGSQVAGLIPQLPDQHIPDFTNPRMHPEHIMDYSSDGEPSRSATLAAVYDGHIVASSDVTIDSSSSSMKDFGDVGTDVPANTAAELIEIELARPVPIDREDDSISVIGSSSPSVFTLMTESDAVVVSPARNSSASENVERLVDTVEDRPELGSLQSDNGGRPQHEDAYSSTALENTHRYHSHPSPGTGVSSLSLTSNNIVTVQAVQTGSQSTRAEAIPHCRLCMKISMNPVTTMCGHIFCHGCILMELSKVLHCPTCRFPIFVKLDFLRTADHAH